MSGTRGLRGPGKKWKCRLEGRALLGGYVKRAPFFIFLFFPFFVVIFPIKNTETCKHRGIIIIKVHNFRWGSCGGSLYSEHSNRQWVWSLPCVSWSSPSEGRMTGWDPYSLGRWGEWNGQQGCALLTFLMLFHYQSWYGKSHPSELREIMWPSQKVDEVRTWLGLKETQCSYCRYCICVCV